MNEDTTESKNSTNLERKQKFKYQFKKYLYYTKRWFPFAIIIGLLSGTLMALFSSFVFNLHNWLDFIPIYIRYPVVGGITSLFLYFGFNEVKGAGISYILKHKNTTTKVPRRSIFTKFIVSALTLGVGAPVGREGPSVTIGSAMACAVGDKFKLTKDEEMHAITIGAAACTSAIFSTPLGGSVFASEVPYKNDLDETVFLPSLLASAISLFTFEFLTKVLTSEYIVFQIDNLNVSLGFFSSFHFILLGIIAGIFGILFSVLYKILAQVTEKLTKNFLTPLIGLSITAVIILLLQPFLPQTIELEGTGFSSINNILIDFSSVGILALYSFFW